MAESPFGAPQATRSRTLKRGTRRSRRRGGSSNADHYSPWKALGGRGRLESGEAPQVRTFARGSLVAELGWVEVALELA